MTGGPNDRGPTDDVRLYVGLTIYVLLNALRYWLAAIRVLDFYWPLCMCFSYFIPCAGILSIAFLQTVHEPRPYSWPAVLGFVVVMLVSAAVNLWLLIRAYAEV